MYFIFIILVFGTVKIVLSRHVGTQQLSVGAVHKHLLPSLKTSVNPTHQQTAQWIAHRAAVNNTAVFYKPYL